MFLAWRSASLPDLCASRTGFDTAWPTSAPRARELLSVVSRAGKLDWLMRLRSISTVLAVQSGHVTVTIGLEEVQMFASPLTERGSLVAARAVQDLESVAPVTSLLVHDLTAYSVSLEKATL